MKEIKDSPNKRFKFRRDVGTVNTEPSLTDQSQLKETDVNYIYNKYLKTGEINFIKANVGAYADLTAITDYAEMLMTIQHANETFMSLPAELRTKFDNNAENFITYLQDPKNDDEAIKYGLKIPKPQTANLDNPAQAAPANPSVSKKKQPDLPLTEE